MHSQKYFAILLLLMTVTRQSANLVRIITNDNDKICQVISETLPFQWTWPFKASIFANYYKRVTSGCEFMERKVAYFFKSRRNKNEHKLTSPLSMEDFGPNGTFPTGGDFIKELLKVWTQEVARYRRSLPDKSKILYNINVKHINMDKMTHEMTINGDIVWRWRDERLLNNEVAKRVVYWVPIDEIWVPFNRNHYVTNSNKNGRKTDKDDDDEDEDEAEMARIYSRPLSRGYNVLLRLNLIKKQMCQMDLGEYPRDSHECCTDLDIGRRYFKHLSNGTLSRGGYKALVTPIEWRIEKLAYKIGPRYPVGSEPSDSDYYKKLKSLRFCVTLKRYSTTVYYEYVLPTVSISLLAILVPFFSEWRIQIGAKILAVALFLCAESAGIDRSLGFGKSVPRFLILFDFLLLTTVLSLILTVIFWSLSRRQGWSLPPPNLLLVFGRVVNRYFWFSGNEKFDPPQLNDDGISTRSNFSSDWYNVMLGLNNASLMLFTLIYLIGILVNVA